MKCIHLDQTSMAVKAWRNWQTEAKVGRAGTQPNQRLLFKSKAAQMACEVGFLRRAASPLPPCRVKSGYFWTAFNC